MDFLQKLQNQPRHIRLQILWISVAVCMLIIISLWLVSLKYSLSVGVQKPQAAKEASRPLKEIGKEIPSLMDNLKASVGAFFEKRAEIEKETEKTEPEIKPKQENIKGEQEEVRPAKLPVSQ